MDNTDILIVGAGAAGLIAGRTLAKAGKNVKILEARNRCGGRIHTLNEGKFLNLAELGAEFIHGDLPCTLKVLNEAGISYFAAYGEMVHYKNGAFSGFEAHAEGWDILMQKLSGLTQDTTIEDFLQKYFADEKYTPLKSAVRGFVEGYDSADTNKASTFALRDEWQNEDNEAQHRIKGGYGAMINFLEQEFRLAGGYIRLNTIVKEIKWQTGMVQAITSDGIVYKAGQILIALPLGVLQADIAQQGGINFGPDIPEYTAALNAMGFGAVIKILLEFDKPFWIDDQTATLAGKSLKQMAFLLSDEQIPTWWTQSPQHSNILTGWLGGPAAAEKRGLSTLDLLQLSLQSLSRIFNLEVAELQTNLLAHHVVNWTAEPFTRGSYAYDTIEAPASRKILGTPLNNTLFFAGEYLYEGPAIGTVEAALHSGTEAAGKILECKKG